MRQRGLEHNKVMLDAWTRAAGAFARRLNERVEKGEPPLDSMRAVLSLWLDTANEVLLETQRTDAFLKTQREVLKASTDLSLAQRTWPSSTARCSAIRPAPSSTTSTRPSTELRRELRALKRSTPRGVHRRRR